jgi:NDP-sugar pyrophosphorylase family protein
MDANKELSEKKILIGRGCQIDPSVTFRDWAVVGAKSVIGQGVEIERSVLWEGAVVKESVRVVDSVVSSSEAVKYDLIGDVL